MPGLNWARNMFLPTALSAKQMEHIPTPRLEVHVHVLTKTLQAGIILGGGMVGPIAALIMHNPVLDTALASGSYGAIIGAIAGPVFTELRFLKSSQDAILDRCFRLRYNRTQVRVDRVAYYSAIAGGAVTVFNGAGVEPGLLAGMGIGTILGAFYNATMAHKSDKRPPRTVFLKKD